VTTRRDVLGGLTSAAALAALPGWAAGAEAIAKVDGVRPETLGLALTPEQVGDGIAFLRDHPSVDVHAHPGLFFLRDAPNPTPGMLAFGKPNEDAAIAALGRGRVSCALFAGVSDERLLALSRTGITASRDFAPGEAYADYRRQLAALQALVKAGHVAPGRSAADVVSAHHKGRTACMFAVEGGDFIEDRIDRVAEAYAAGVRAITIVHYHVNQIGDIQSAPPQHGGITPLGRRIVEAMNASGMIVDLAHAPLSVTRGAVKVSTRPMMISHTNLTRPGLEHPRLITPEHARLVTQNSGLIGSVPSGIGQKTLADWIDNIVRMAETVGPDHVAIGTDMDANYAPVFTDYRLWHLIPAALLARGMTRPELRGIIGANFLALLQAQGKASRKLA
jgi:membrane dipeptidase